MVTSGSLDDLYSSMSNHSCAYFSLGSGVTGGPVSDTNGCAVRIERWDAGAGRMFFWQFETKMVYTSVKYSVWQDWQQIYDTSLLTNSTMLSSLASALGALSNKVIYNHGGAVSANTEITVTVPNYGIYCVCDSITMRYGNSCAFFLLTNAGITVLGGSTRYSFTHNLTSSGLNIGITCDANMTNLIILNWAL